jgi:hypothetical protein
MVLRTRRCPPGTSVLPVGNLHLYLPREAQVIRRIRVLGIPILTIETDDDDEPGDAITTETTIGFVVDDLPLDHRKGW